MLNMPKRYYCLIENDHKVLDHMAVAIRFREYNVLREYAYENL